MKNRAVKSNPVPASPKEVVLTKSHENSKPNSIEDQISDLESELKRLTDLKEEMDLSVANSRNESNR